MVVNLPFSEDVLGCEQLLLGAESVTDTRFLCRPHFQRMVSHAAAGAAFEVARTSTTWTTWTRETLGFNIVAVETFSPYAEHQRGHLPTIGPRNGFGNLCAGQALWHS